MADDATVTFRHADPGRRVAGVRLRQGVGLAEDGLDFRYEEESGTWELQVPRPPVGRMEYELELLDADGGSETVVDPANPLRTPGAFGDRSVVEFPGYAPPRWLGEPTGLAGGRWRTANLVVDGPAGALDARIWSPDGDDASGVLVAHDGPEYDRLAALSRYVRATIGAGTVPPFHLVLLEPGDRNRRYAADPDYADALAGDALPALRRDLDGPVVGMGASLGALAMLHASRRHPDAFDALFLQSGSFFVPRHDRHENGFAGYRRIVRFVLPVLRAGASARPIPVVLTCGTAEENLHNNRRMAAALHAQGHPGGLVEVADAHTYVGWRDAFDPHLTALLVDVLR